VGEKAVAPLDAVLHEVSGVAEVLASRAAGDTIAVRTGAADGGHDEVARCDGLHCRGHFHDLGQALVAEHEVVGAGGHRAELEAAKLTAHAPHTHAHDHDT